MKIKQKFAYTIAEVLITLGIIGVVSAMTISTIKSKIENYVLRNQFLKQYNNISSVMNNLDTDNGEPYICYMKNSGYTVSYSDCQNFWNLFFEQFKVINKCQYGDENCAPIYKGIKF